ncbi:MAG: 2-C-methyl-D-erythritol 4-phosphate cytidylyltransferase [Bacteroidales bacterium]|nr:2-C-methyl-D-erythritol 4-phosphate cytidylyltransferase [Bacteroidales bacterium]
MERKIFGIFVAGGQGTRMGVSTPKQFLDLEGETVLQRSIEKFLEACPSMEVVTVLPREHVEVWKDICSRGSLNCRQLLVVGGITRFHSVKNALERIPPGVTVLVHDGVRPLLSVGFIRRLIEESGTARALVPVVPVADTLKSVKINDEGKLVPSGLEDPDRSTVRGAQTPQIFRSEDLKAAYTQPYDIRYTDDASVAAAYGIPITYTEGEKYNFKITTPEDLALAKLIFS